MRSLNADEYEGWEVYPQNLRLPALEVDAFRSNLRISQLSKELFVANNESSFGYLGLGAQKTGMYLESWCSAVVNRWKDGSRDVALEYIQTTERMSALMELAQATSLLLVGLLYVINQELIEE